MKDEDFADGIYWILHAVNYVEGGGYDISCGIDFRNDVFETRNFWGSADADCDCGLAEWEYEIDSQAMDRMKRYGPEPDDLDSEWWRLYNMELRNVTQGETRTHSDTCVLVQPQFRHFSSGLEVSWYKRVGRSTESNKSMKTLDWYRIVVECLESLKGGLEQSG